MKADLQFLPRLRPQENRLASLSMTMFQDYSNENDFFHTDFDDLWATMMNVFLESFWI